MSARKFALTVFHMVSMAVIVGIPNARIERTGGRAVQSPQSSLPFVGAKP